ncbi:MAG TPA: DUF2380 domain-containing protein [Aurantimonas coralicida]|uniref:DUF2380 domain-containing protein n=2 Tax=root TaxID=1 RepID=A0A9C9TIV3_9HYPH|nr:DUF2380 domain-containing protein [Aurantimonas coralicida]HEU02940.1 DUF2380 domain-containing protein [Aurantimonas coralicida]
MCYGPRIPRQARFFPVVLALLLAAPALAAEKTVAVFDFELIDSSLEGSMIGKNPEERARLETMAPALRGDIDTLPGYASVDIAPVRDKALAQNLESCGNCALSFARTLGADIAVTGTVQKVSNLILNINAYAFDVESGQPIARGSADIRSNTDESWRRGIAYLWKNVLKKQFEAAP